MLVNLRSLHIPRQLVLKRLLLSPNIIMRRSRKAPGPALDMMSDITTKVGIHFLIANCIDGFYLDSTKELVHEQGRQNVIEKLHTSVESLQGNDWGISYKKVGGLIQPVVSFPISWEANWHLITK